MPHEEHTHSHGECCTRPAEIWNHPRYQEWYENAKRFMAENGREPAPARLEDLDAGDVAAKGGN